LSIPLVALLLCAVPPPARGAGESVFVNGLEGGLACTTLTGGPVQVVIPSFVVTPTFLLNGSPFSASPLESATFFLIPAEGEPIALGTSFAPAPVRVLAGVYDVEYRWRSGTTVPRNVAARVMQAVPIAANTPLVVDVPGQLVTGALTLDGAPYPQAGSTLLLEGVHGLGRVVLGSTPQPTYSVRLIPGAYRFGYESVTPALFLPANRRALRGRYDIDPGVRVVDFDLPSVSATFQFRFDNVLAPNQVIESGAVSLRSDDGDRIDLGVTNQQTVGWRIVPGTYDAFYEFISGSSVAPANVETRFIAGRTFGAGPHIINVPTAYIEGPLLINGVIAPAVPTEWGRVWLRDHLTGEDTLLGSTDFQSYGRRIVRGTYDLVYTHFTGSVLVPRNDRAVFEYDRSFQSPGNHPLDIPMASVAIALTLNGVTFPAVVPENARLYLRSPADDQDIFGPSTNALGAGSAPWLLLRGTYAPVLSHFTGSSFIPINDRARIDADFVAQPGVPAVQSFDVRTGVFDFEFRNNAVAFGNNQVNVAAFELRHFDDVVSLGRTNFDVGPRILVRNVEPLPDGRHGTVYYTWQAGTGTTIPRNIGSPAACVMFDPD
jgi:hypothetical protein